MNIFYGGMSPLSSRVLYTSLLYIPTYIKSFLTIIIAILLICRTCRHYYKIYNGYKVNFNYSSLKQIVWPTVPKKITMYMICFDLYTCLNILPILAIHRYLIKYVAHTMYLKNYNCSWICIYICMYNVHKAE